MATSWCLVKLICPDCGEKLFQSYAYSSLLCRRCNKYVEQNHKDIVAQLPQEEQLRQTIFGPKRERLFEPITTNKKTKMWKY